MHPASHTFQYPKVTPVAPQGAGGTKPPAGPQTGAATPQRPQR
ncbi:hypothetical protein DSM104299_04276 [Baekduia alba]|nr:hypothetical protein [Baekduia alba]WCB95527.1 hypothetical protein DSM104299_04276 [Baekduia alba]